MSNIQQFTATSIALLGSAVGWQSAIARRLGIESRTVRRWIAAGQAPEWAMEKLTELAGGAGASPWPRDEWIHGDATGADGKRREYIYHTQPPRFLARIVELDADGVPLPKEEPADVLSGMVYGLAEDMVLCEIEWIDEVATGEHVKWLEAAAEAIVEDALS